MEFSNIIYKFIPNLHSTMFIFILSIVIFKKEISLIYIPLCLYLYSHIFVKFFIWHIFTFHYVYIYIPFHEIYHLIWDAFTFHYVYIYIWNTDPKLHPVQPFTFHYVYIYIQLISYLSPFRPSYLHSTMFIFIC